MAAGLGQATAHHEHGAWLEELGQCLQALEHKGILQQGLQLLGRAGSSHEDA